MKEKLKNLVGKKFFGIAVAAFFAFAGFFIVLFFINGIEAEGYYLNRIRIIGEKAEHIEKPEIVKGIYLTAYTVGTKRLDELVAFVKRNKLNSMVIDVKGPQGEIAFALKKEALQKYNPKRPLYNPGEIIRKLHNNDIYAIARVFVFQDPFFVSHEPQYALKKKGGGFWSDYKGVKWLDPTIREVWQYNADIAKEVYELGFDEVQFDYIRFPSDGNLATIEYANWDGKTPKEVEMERFFRYLRAITEKSNIPISADLFGLVCCYEDYDLGIGQKLDRALPYFDFISPMMYPSHYSSGFIGLKNPASHPYEVLKHSMVEANKIRDKILSSTSTPLAELRPWIQDFDLGDNYDAYKVLEQARAINEEHGEGFLIWNARNVYTEIGI